MGQGRVVIARKHALGGGTSKRLITYLILGFALGLSLGYVMMGMYKFVGILKGYYSEYNALLQLFYAHSVDEIKFSVRRNCPRDHGN